MLQLTACFSTQDFHCSMQHALAHRTFMASNAMTPHSMPVTDVTHCAAKVCGHDISGASLGLEHSFSMFLFLIALRRQIKIVQGLVLRSSWVGQHFLTKKCEKLSAAYLKQIGNGKQQALHFPLKSPSEAYLEACPTLPSTGSHSLKQEWLILQYHEQLAEERKCSLSLHVTTRKLA